MARGASIIIFFLMLETKRVPEMLDLFSELL